MSSDQPNSAEGKDNSAERWAKDPDGRTVYCPFGLTTRGYLIVDADRERAVRAAEQRYQTLNRRLNTYFRWLLVPCAFGLAYFRYSNPGLALAIIAAPFIALAVINKIMPRALFGDALVGLPRVELPRVAAPEPIAMRPLYYAAFVILAVLGAMALVVYLYDQRVGKLAGDSTTVDFYPDVSGELLGAVLSIPIVWVIFVGWEKIAEIYGELRTLMSALVFSFGGLILVIVTLFHVLRPEPRIIISRDFLSCDWHVRWRDITDLDLSAGRRGKQYARVALAAGRAGKDQNVPAEFCEITNLTTDSTVVYAAMQAAWKKATARSAAAPPDDGLDQIPQGSSREKVLAVLGPPTASAWQGVDQVWLYLRQGDSNPSTSEAGQMVIAVYLYPRHGVVGTATYRLENGRVVDAVSHKPPQNGTSTNEIDALLRLRALGIASPSQ